MSDDYNLAVLSGRLSEETEIRHFTDGSTRARLWVSVRWRMPPNRVDILPVEWWDPPDELAEVELGTRVVVLARLRRRFWATADGRTSRIELVAVDVDFPQPDEPVDP